MNYVCDVLYAVLYVRVSCFVMHGYAVSRIRIRIRMILFRIYKCKWCNTN